MPRTTICAFLLLACGRQCGAKSRLGRALEFIHTADVSLSIGGSSNYIYGQTAAALYAGVNNAPVIVDVRPSGYGSPFKPRFRLTPVNGTCATKELEDSKVAAPYSGEVTVTLQDSFVGRNDEAFIFFMGGEFQLCYSEHGLFDLGTTDVIDVVLPVYGVFDNCSSSGCLAALRYHCHVLRNAQSAAGSCTLNYGREGQGYTGPTGAGTWSAAFAATYDADGVSQSITTQACAQTGPDDQYIGTDGVDRLISPTAASSYKEIPLPQTLGTLNGTSLAAFTVAACYCPNYGGCDVSTEFVQQIGLIHFFLMKVCASEGCINDYSGVVPKHSFVLRTECPPDACSTTATSRLKLVTADTMNDLPDWNASNGCRTALQSDELGPLGSCSSATSCTIDGGTRQDYKTFSGLWVLADGADTTYAAERYDLRHLHTARAFDACFCMASCESASSWFKVGQLRVSSWRLVGHSDLGQADDVKVIEYMDLSGSLGFARPANDTEALGLNTGGVLKLLSDDTLALDDSRCATEAYDSSFVTGPSNESAAFMYKGEAASDRIVFNGGVTTRKITVRRAGIVAVCYCHFATALGCSDAAHWKLSARLTVRGPNPNQVWEFSVDVPVRIAYVGWGLESDNVLRIIDQHSTCTSNSGNPSSEDPAVLLGCPDNCQQPVDSLGQATNIATLIATHNTTGCDGQHSRCSTVYLTGIDTSSLASATSIGASKTVLSFTADPGLSDGDVVALGSEVTGGSTEQLAAIVGVYPFEDAGSYLVGHHVTPHGSGLTDYTVSLGWLSGSAPTFTVTGSAGTWKRHSQAVTKEEILAVAERQNMKVCWAPSSTSTFLAQVGTASFLEPPTAYGEVSPVSTVVDVSQPVVVSFKTGARARYTTTEEAMRLRLVVPNTDFFEVDFDNASTTEVTLAEATRTMCGQLFRELWSSDGRGFPYPQGCYFGPQRTRGGIGTREFYILFEPRAGLAPGVHYQMVLQATLRNGIRAGDELLRVSALGSASEQQRVVVEQARCSLSRTPTAAPVSAYGPQLASLELLGTSGLSRLGSNDEPLQLKLSGVTGRSVTAGSRLRVIFRPLTLWSLGLACIVTCTPSPGHSCGRINQCHGEAVATSVGSRNIAHVVLPADLTPITGSVEPTLSFWALDQPGPGFFPTKLAAQLTRADDLLPQFLETSGAYLFSERSGAVVASVVTRDGNSKPFHGDTGNELYVRLAFSVTLLGRSSGTSYLDVTLPVGYSCLAASAANDSLSFFDFEALPMRLGSLPAAGLAGDGAWTFTNNTCRYSLVKDGVIYGASVVYVRLEVDNPTSPLQQSNSDWQVMVSSPGEDNSTVSMPTVAFSTPEGMAERLAGGVSVLGKLTGASVQPSDFTPGAWQQLRLFFRTQQSAGSRGEIVLDAPLGFDFGSPCAATDLSASAYGAGLTVQLPGITGCKAMVVVEGLAGRHDRAVIQVSGELAADTSYGLQVLVQNSAAEDFAAAALSSWKLVTRAEGELDVDAVQDTLQLNPADSSTSNGAWGLYQQRLASPSQVAIAISSYTPYSIASTLATATIFPLKVPSNVSSELRIIAPLGYLWVINDLTKYGNTSVIGATADLPGGLPAAAAGNSTLEWMAAAYKTQETYGFICQLSVPDATPSASVNSFFVELGDWTSGDISRRHAAGIVEVQEVQALRDVLVQPSHNVVGVDTTLTVQVRTISSIPQSGGLVLTSPPDFGFQSSCTIEAAVGSAPLPAGVTCASQVVTGGVTEVEVTAVSSAIPPALYRVQLLVSNPASPVTNTRNDTSPCGFEQCWTITSLLDMSNRALYADRAAVVPGYAVLARMPKALLVALSEEQAAAVRQNDRPGQHSQLVVAMELNNTPNATGVLRLTGPRGTRFSPDCLQGVVTDSAHVFGSATLFDSVTYASWAVGAEVVSCSGEANTASVVVMPGLQAGRLYPWRMELLSTPTQAPLDNTWTLEFAEEASEPFASFSLRTFADAALEPTSTATWVAGASALAAPPLAVTFRPHSTVVGGLLRLQAPPSFRFDSSGGACTAEVQQLSADGDVAATFTSGAHICRVDPRTPWVLLLELTGGASLQAGVLHRFTTLVQNPSMELPAQAWTLQSFAPGGGATAGPLDEAQLPGFAVVRAATLWSVALAATGGEQQSRGLEPVLLRLVAASPATLQPGDKLEAMGPDGFTFSDSQRQCNEFAWITDLPVAGGPLLHELQGVTASCAEPGKIVVTYAGSTEIAAGARLALRVGTTNPRVTPGWADNVWRFVHLRSSHILAAGVQAGYAVMPQLEALEVSLVGDLLAAQSVSALNVSFRVVSNCSFVRISADSPAGFNLASAVLLQAFVNGEPIPAARILPEASVALVGSTARALQDTAATTAASSSTVHIEASIGAGQAVLLSLGNVKLGVTGGQTKWTLQTFTAVGAPLDQRSAAGFRLPGLISTVHQALFNELDPRLDPIQRTASEKAILSQWKARVHSPAVAEFTLRFSNQVEAHDELQVSTDAGYVVQGEDLQLFSVNASGERVRVSIIPPNASSEGNRTGQRPEVISLKVLQPLLPEVDHVLVLPLQTASQIGQPGLWRFETRRAEEPLPIHTNDAQLPGFHLAEVLTVNANAAHVPPAASLAVSLNMSFGEIAPSVLHVVLPETYKAPEHCAVSPDLQCTASIGNEERKSLYIQRSNGGSFGSSATIEVLVIVPWSEPVSRAWFLEGLTATSAASASLLLTSGVGSAGIQAGWGEDRLGIALTPLTGTAVQYGAVPFATTALLLTFNVVQRAGMQVRSVRVLPPSGYEARCEASLLRLLSSDNHTTCLEEPFTLSLSGGSVFGAGSHALLLGIRVPESDPSTSSSIYDGSFKVLLLDSSDMVVDANMQVPALPIASQLLRAEQPTLAWTSSLALSEPYVTLLLRITRALPVGGEPVAMAGLLLQTPEGFRHAVFTLQDIKNLNSDFPLLPGQWAEFDSEQSTGSFFASSAGGKDFRQIRILRDESRRVPVGTYRWSFPVRIPAQEPLANVWRVSLCTVRACRSSLAAETSVDFVIRGFRIGEESNEDPYDPVGVAASAEHTHCTLASLIATWLLLAAH